MEAGLALLQEGGMENFSIRKAAKNCGLTPRAPYNYFQNSNALLAAIQDEMVKDIIKQAGERIAGCSDGERARMLTAFALELQKIYSENTSLIENADHNKLWKWYSIARDGQLKLGVTEEPMYLSDKPDPSHVPLILTCYLEGTCYLTADGYLSGRTEERAEELYEQISLLLTYLGLEADHGQEK